MDSTRMSFGDHLDELRSCLIRALFGVVVGMALCLTFGKSILGVICLPLLIIQDYNGLQPSTLALAPTTPFVVYLKIGMLSGAIVAMPWVLYQIWRFVAVGLFPHERRFVRMLLPTSIGLFVVGVLFLYFIVLPIVLQFFITFNNSFTVPDLTPTPIQKLLLPGQEEPPPETTASPPLNVPVLNGDPENPSDGDVWINARTRRLLVKTPQGVLSTSLEPGATSPVMQSVFALDFYISFVLMLALAFGIAFETPIVVFFLAWSRLVSAELMARGRRYVLFGTVVLAAILTPPDVVSQLLLAGPMYVLFELGLLIAKVTARKASS